MIDDFESRVRAVATVRSVARMVGLSPSRFYQLQQAGVFPLPVYDIHTRRPLYTEEQQRQCIEVRRRNCGINGKPVLFYARRFDAAGPNPRVPRVSKSKATKAASQHFEIVESLKALGLAVNTSAVDEAVRKLFPQGTGSIDPAEITKAVFLELKSQNSGDNVR